MTASGASSSTARLAAGAAAVAGWTASAVAVEPADRQRDRAVVQDQLRTGDDRDRRQPVGGWPSGFGDDQVEALQAERARAEAQQGDPVGRARPRDGRGRKRSRGLTPPGSATICNRPAAARETATAGSSSSAPAPIRIVPPRSPRRRRAARNCSALRTTSSSDDGAAGAGRGGASRSVPPRPAPRPPGSTRASAWAGPPRHPPAPSPAAPRPRSPSAASMGRFIGIRRGAAGAGSSDGRGAVRRAAGGRSRPGSARTRTPVLRRRPGVDRLRALGPGSWPVRRP